MPGKSNISSENHKYWSNINQDRGSNNFHTKDNLLPFDFSVQDWFNQILSNKKMSKPFNFELLYQRILSINPYILFYHDKYGHLLDNDQIEEYSF